MQNNIDHQFRDAGERMVLELAISGMSCNACALTIKKNLENIEGVEASVNYATEMARVFVSNETVNAELLISAVMGLGYGARLLEDTTPDMLDAENREKVTALKVRLLASAVLAFPVFVVSMFSQLQFAQWQWWTLVLSAPVVTWGAWPFHRAALMNARNQIGRAHV